jgi:microcystin-dependent protein
MSSTLRYFREQLTFIEPGTVSTFAGSVAPNGWLMCDGSIVSRFVYPELFRVISTTYGSGDGSTTFQLPDLRSRIPLGAGQGVNLTSRALGATGGQEGITDVPLHTHDISDPGHNHSYTDVYNDSLNVHTLTTQDIGANDSTTTLPPKTTGSSFTGITINETGIPLVDVMNPFLVMNYIIKF